MGRRAGFLCKVVLAVIACSVEAFGQTPAPVTLRDVVFEPDSSSAKLMVLERTAFGGLSWRSLCRGPCTTRAAVGAPYWVEGDDLITSRKFAIYPNPGPFIVRAQMGSRIQRTIGIVMIPVGGALFLVGAASIGFASAGCIECTEEERHDAAAPGVVTMLLGVPVLLAGIGLALSNDTTLSFGPSATSGASRLHVDRIARSAPLVIQF